MSGDYVVHATRDDEQEAREVAEGLWDQGRKAVVVRVSQMPDPPRTTNRWAVLAEPV